VVRPGERPGRAVLRFVNPRFAVNPRLRNGSYVIRGNSQEGAAKRPRFAEGSRTRPDLRTGHPVDSLNSQFRGVFLTLSVT
jgi:hypothetical protein